MKSPCVQDLLYPDTPQNKVDPILRITQHAPSVDSWRERLSPLDGEHSRPQDYDFDLDSLREGSD